MVLPPGPSRTTACERRRRMRRVERWELARRRRRLCGARCRARVRRFDVDRRARRRLCEPVFARRARRRLGITTTAALRRFRRTRRVWPGRPSLRARRRPFQYRASAAGCLRFLLRAIDVLLRARRPRFVTVLRFLRLARRRSCAAARSWPAAKWTYFVRLRARASRRSCAALRALPRDGPIFLAARLNLPTACDNPWDVLRRRRLGFGTLRARRSAAAAAWPMPVPDGPQ